MFIFIGNHRSFFVLHPSFIRYNVFYCCYRYRRP